MPGCSEPLAQSRAKDFDGLRSAKLVVLDTTGLSLAHPRSREFAPQILGCGLRCVLIDSEQILFTVDEIEILAPSGGYVSRDRAALQLRQCPYGMVGHDGQPGRLLEERWYYCRA